MQYSSALSPVRSVEHFPLDFAENVVGRIGVDVALPLVYVFLVRFESGGINRSPVVRWPERGCDPFAPRVALLLDDRHECPQRQLKDAERENGPAERCTRRENRLG